MDYSQLNDEQLALELQRLAAESPSDSYVIKNLYEEIYNRYYTRSFYLTRYYNIPHNDAEDVVQESFIRLFKSIHTYKSGKMFKPWFFKIILNCVRKKHNEIKRRRYKNIDDIQDLPSAEEKNNLDKVQFKQYLNDITSKIPDKLREVLLLKVHGDLDYDEIARVVNISSRQVYNRLDQAYILIRKLMEEVEI